MEVESHESPAKEDMLNNFEYVEFYKTQLSEIKLENERLKENNARVEQECKSVKDNCLMLVEKICKDNNFLRERLEKVSLMHLKGTRK